MTSAPAFSAEIASLTVVTLANHLIFLSLRALTKSVGYKPMIEDTTLGPASKEGITLFLEVYEGYVC